MKNISLKTAIYGVVIGDALGLPVQFLSRGSYEKITDLTGYGTFNLPAGSWSDDSSLTIATCDSIREKGCIDVADIREKFEKWYYDGAYTPFGYAYDIGRTCSIAISSGRGCRDERSNGNGSLMRIMPLAFVPDVTDEEIAAVSSITHGHRVSQEGCIIYIRIAQDLMQGIDLKESICNHIPETSIYKRCRTIDQLPIESIRSSGYIVDSLEAALWCLLTTGSYADCVIAAANLGDDTDSIAAIAGGLAAILYGNDSIPASWIDGIVNREAIDKTLF